METSLRFDNASFPLPSFSVTLCCRDSTPFSRRSVQQALGWPATPQISSPKSLSKFLNVSVSHSWSSIFNNNIGSGRLNIKTINVSGEFRKKVAFPWICKLFPLPADTSSIRCNINKSAIYNNKKSLSETRWRVLKLVISAKSDNNKITLWNFSVYNANA